MFLSGYHGTSLEAANNIIKQRKYKKSNNDKDWLGPGIYFYSSFSDAYDWKNAETILHSVIKIKEDEYLDLTSPMGVSIYNEIIDWLYNDCNIRLDKNKKQQNQCSIFKIIWNREPYLKVISAEFARERSKFDALIDLREKRKEFCVRNNECIKHTYSINRSDIE